MNKLKTFFIVESAIKPSYPEDLDAIVNRWIEENSVTVISVSICHRGGTFVVALLYEDDES